MPRRQEGTAGGAIDVLSDTAGFDTAPYLGPVLKTIRQNWYHLIPASAKAPVRKQGVVAIRFTVMRDGTIRDMELDQSANDIALDRAAWGGIAASSPLPPLPAEFPGSYLTVRFRFLYNMEREAEPIGWQGQEGISRLGWKAQEDISHQGVAVHITVPPNLRVVIGSYYLITASVKGTEDTSLEWKLSGEGCVGPACGTVIDGFYFAPSALPEPPVVTVRAVSKAVPQAQSYIKIRLVPPGGRK